MPKKPSKPLGHIVFPKSGPPSLVSERLPASKHELEQVIIRKFVAALHQRFQRTLAPPTRGTEWPDFWTSEGTARIGIEVVEVVNPDHVAGGEAYRTSLPVSLERAHQLLTETIRSKIGKHYQNPQGWSLWLVAYDVTSALAGDHDIAGRNSHAYLQTIAHPFGEVWLIWPAADDLPGFLESVWPTTQFTSTEQRP